MTSAAACHVDGNLFVIILIPSDRDWPDLERESRVVKDPRCRVLWRQIGRSDRELEFRLVNFPSRRVAIDRAMFST
jgi:hypothetical protein